MSGVSERNAISALTMAPCEKPPSTTSPGRLPTRVVISSSSVSTRAAAAREPGRPVCATGRATRCCRGARRDRAATSRGRGRRPARRGPRERSGGWPADRRIVATNGSHSCGEDAKPCSRTSGRAPSSTSRARRREFGYSTVCAVCAAPASNRTAAAERGDAGDAQPHPPSCVNPRPNLSRPVRASRLQLRRLQATAYGLRVAGRELESLRSRGSHARRKP